MRTSKQNGVFLGLTLLVSGAAHAQEPAMVPPAHSVASSWPTASTNSAWFARAWRSDDGLPGNTVVGIGQAPDGFLWVATETGLVRFDGVRFQEIAALRDPALAFLADRHARLWLAKSTTSAGGEVLCWEAERRRVFDRSAGLPDRGADALVEDPEGTVWLGAGNSICRIKEGRCTAFPIEPDLPSGGGKIHLACDGRGQLWFARRNQVGLYHDGGGRTLLTLNEPCGALRGAVSGGVWIAAGRRLLKCSAEDQTQDFGELPARRANAAITALYEDCGGRLWVGTKGAGLLLYNGSGFDEVALADREILCLAKDREGSLWVGTRGGGLVRVRPRTFEFQALSSDGSAEGVRSVCQDTGGRMWAVTQDGRLARKEGSLWRLLSAADGWSGPAATCVTAAPEGGVWVGTESGGLLLWHNGEVRALNMQDGLASKSLTGLLTAPSGDVWLGTVSSNAVQRLRDGQFQTFRLPQQYGHFGSLAVDASGGLWAATVGGVLARVSQDTLVDQTPSTLRTLHPIASLCATPDGSLWIGYRGLGVGRLLKGRFTRFGTEQGLWDEYILHMVADGAGRLWFAANRGLFAVAENEFAAVADDRQARVRSVVYGQDEGVPALQAGSGFWPGAARSRDGRLWIPVVGGLLVVAPGRFAENREPPPVLVERVMVDGQLLAAYGPWQGAEASHMAVPLDLRQPNTCLRLGPGPRQVELEYTGLSFVSPRNMAFKYRLQGLDSDWVEAGSRRVAYYSHLPAGNYRFEVMACNNDGVWNQAAASLALTVLPHFWQTGWFLLLSLAAFTTGVGSATWTAARWRNRRRIERLEQVNALERERSRIARDIHDELGSNLTRIAWLSELTGTDRTQPDQVEIYSRKIGGYARQMVRSLDEIVWAVNPSNDTLQSLAQYLTHLAHEYLGPTSVNCRLEIPSDLPAIALPAEIRHDLFLATKEAIHNILKHAAAREARIGLAVTDGVLTLVVEDNGRGFAPAGPSPSRPGHGLANLRQRFENLGGQFQCESAPGRGTRLRFTVKLPDRT